MEAIMGYLLQIKTDSENGKIRMNSPKEVCVYSLAIPSGWRDKNYSVEKRIQADFHIKHISRQVTQNKEPQITLESAKGNKSTRKL